MPLSFANITPTNFELAPCRVTYKGVDLGATLGNVVTKIETSLADLKSDQLGTTVIDRKVSGHKITIETELAETQFKDNWKVVFPFHNLVTSGPNKLFYFASALGSSLRASAGSLILHPLSRGDGDLAGDVKIFLAAGEGKADYMLAHAEQNKLKIVWHMYPDFTTTPVRFMLFGDPSVGLINASFTGPTYVGTGNGTMTGTTVYNGFTKTETITATCVTAATNSGTFFVSGTSSGALGLATVGSGFVSPEITFTINDGTSDFIVGDQFTIPTTAANYV